MPVGLSPLIVVREARVELACLAAHAPETCASTNSAIPANGCFSEAGAKIRGQFYFPQASAQFFFSMALHGGFFGENQACPGVLS